MAPHFFSLLTKTKRRKTNQPIKKKQGKPDRLSDLPNDLIIQILCLLELKDAVQTSVLSKRWNLLWTEIHTINFNNHFEPDFDLGPNQRRKQVSDYLSSVEKTLTRISRIRNFSLAGFHSFYCCFTDDIVGEWIQYALESNVETMNIEYTGLVSNPPRSMFRSLSLTQLEISRGNFDWETTVNLPLLKSLFVSHIYLSDGRLEAILAGCPVLETLVLTKVTRLNTMRVISPSLKRSVLIDVKYEGTDVDYILEINAPLLEELEISGDFMATKCVFASLCSLVKARLVFKICLPLYVDEFGDVIETNDIQRTVKEVLKSVCHVGDLTIGGTLLQVLTMLIEDKPSLTFLCEQLRIVSPLYKYDLPGIVCVLEEAPNLESLTVEVYVPEAIYILDQAKNDFFVNHLYLICCANANLLHLKNVKIDYQWNPCTDRPRHLFQTEEYGCDFELVDYVLRSCVVLERLVVCSPRSACGNDTKCLKPYCTFQRVNQLSCKLLTHTLPTNEDGEWELKKRKFSLEYDFSKSFQV